MIKYRRTGPNIMASYLVFLGLALIFQAINGFLVPHNNEMFDEVEQNSHIFQMKPIDPPQIRGKETLELPSFLPHFHGNLTSCVQFFFDVQLLPRSFAGLTDALYTATTQGGPLISRLLNCTRLNGFFEILSCIQGLETEMRQFYIALHPLFTPACHQFTQNITKLKTELDDCLLKPNDLPNALKKLQIKLY